MSQGRDAPQRLTDPTTGRPVLMAPQRQGRPILTGAGADRPCPFCPGNERQTPPELDAVRAAGSAKDAPGWTVRAFANKYPATMHHEVVAEGAAHCEQPADLGVAAWREAIGVWQRRIAALEARPGVATAYWFKNVGGLAGASIPHCHSQILGVDELPPRLLLERDRARAMPSCPWCDALATAAADGRLVFAGPAHSVLLPAPTKLPFETWLLPHDCGDDFLRTDAGSLAIALHTMFVAVAAALHRPAFNVWLHRIPGERFHWHFELQPRTGHLAGLELGGDMYINSVPAPLAAARLRAALAGG